MSTITEESKIVQAIAFFNEGDVCPFIYVFCPYADEDNCKCRIGNKSLKTCIYY